MTDDAIKSAIETAEIVPFPTPIKPKTEQRCPVEPLGINDPDFVFMTPRGRIKRLTASQLNNKGEIRGLFETEAGWLWEAFPAYSRPKDGEQPHVTGWNHGAAGEWLLVQAAARGLVDPDRLLRGPGVWLGGDGGLIVHSGDRLWLNGRVETVGRKVGAHIYPAAPPEPPPDFANPATVEEARDLFAVVRRWHWKTGEAGARLWVGFNGAAMLCGALPWRPHLRVCADQGAGKTELENLQEEILGGERVIERASDPSAAYVRQILGTSARPVILDEVEPSPGHSRAEGVLELVRLASSDKQGPVGRGGADGRPSRHFVRACIYFTSILAPKTLPQDRSRITDLEIGALPAGVDNAGVLADIVRMGALGNRFRARMILGWRRFQQNRLAFSRAMARNAAARRQIDQLATLLAAAETMLSDVPIEEARAEDLVDGMGLEDIADDDRDHHECLNHLLTSSPDIYRAGGRKTVGDWIEEATLQNAAEARGEVLPRLGLRVVRPNNQGWGWLLVATKHQSLEAIFAGTRWAGGVWAQSLARLDGALSYAEYAEKFRCATTVRIGGAPVRYVALPKAAVCAPDLMTETDNPGPEEEEITL